MAHRARESTLLEMLNGQRRPSKGKVLFGGDVLHDHPALLDRIGFVPQHDIMYRDLTIFGAAVPPRSGSRAICPTRLSSIM